MIALHALAGRVDEALRALGDLERAMAEGEAAGLDPRLLRDAIADGLERGVRDRDEMVALYQAAARRRGFAGGRRS